MFERDSGLLTSLTNIFGSLTSGASEVATVATSAVSKAMGFLDENPVAKKLAKAATSSVFSTEDTNQRQTMKIPSLDYEQAKVNTRADLSILRNDRLQTALNRIDSRDINLGDIQRVKDMSAPAVRMTSSRLRPMSIQRTAIKSTVKQPTSSTRKT